VPSIDVTIEPSPPCVTRATFGAADAEADAAADEAALEPSFCAAAFERLALALLFLATITPATMPPMTSSAMMPPQMIHVRRFEVRCAAAPRRPANGDEEPRASVGTTPAAPYLPRASVEAYWAD